MKVFSSKRFWIAAAAFVLLLFLLRPGVSRLKSRVIASISSGLGRSVDIASVHVRLLPRPAFDLANLVVYDDPAFGAEPMLRAADVTASLRLTSLVRGRIEIARLDLSEPSLNVVRGENGRWNVEGLLEHTARIPLAPTTKSKTEPRPGFPYIEATSARINFKTGAEKKPYALTNADFSLWQASENSWSVRLKAQPVRSDLNLNDMGMLRVTGTWQRAPTLRDTPLEFAVEWDRGQLGQLTKFFTSTDQGWRGAVLLQVKLTGSPAMLQISSDAAVQDFRRYDITTGEPLGLAAHCDGQYSAPEHMFHDVMCGAPVGNGAITLKGDVGLPGSHQCGLMLMAENVPAAAAAALFQRIKKNLPEDLTAAGSVHGSLAIDESAATLRLDGQGEITNLRLTSASNKAEIGLASIPFAIASGEETSYGRTRKRSEAIRMPAGPHLEFGPLALAAGRPGTANARGWVNRGGYSLVVSGEAEIAKTLRLARTVGLPALNSTAEGAAQLDLKVSGSWPGSGEGGHTEFPGAQITGSAKLHNVHVTPRGVGTPIEIASADLQLRQGQVDVEKLMATAAGTVWAGSLQLPRGCGTPEACEVRFDLSTDRIALGELAEWAAPRPKDRPWYRVLDAAQKNGPSVLGTLRASGRITANRFLIRGLVANRVAAEISLDQGDLQISELTADFLGGKHRGTWQADFSAKPASCGGNGTFSGLMLAQLDGSIHNAGIAGTGKMAYQISGPCSPDFWQTAEAKLDFDARDAVLPQVTLVEDEGPLVISRVFGEARLHAGKIELKDVQLDSPSGKFRVAGTASLKRELDLKLARGALAAAGGFSITGTLAEPRVELLPGTEQARLKAAAAK